MITFGMGKDHWTQEVEKFESADGSNIQFQSYAVALLVGANVDWVILELSSIHTIKAAPSDKPT